MTLKMFVLKKSYKRQFINLLSNTILFKTVCPSSVCVLNIHKHCVKTSIIMEKSFACSNIITPNFNKME